MTALLATYSPWTYEPQEPNLRRVEPVSPMHRALGRAIAERRRDVGLSQEQLGLEAGIDRTYVGGVERGERNVSLSNLLRLAAAMQAKPSELLAAAEASSQWGDGVSSLPRPRRRRRP